MKDRTKKVANAVIVTLLCLTFLLTGCKKEEYRTDVDTKDLAARLSQKMPTESAWINEDQGFIEEYVAIPESVKASHVYYAQNTNDLDEFGVFWVEDGQAKAVRNMLAQDYLQKRYNENREWYDSYMPTETPKLRDAEVRVYGNCVAYAVLSQENRKAFFEECEKLLKNPE